jgi:AcrR family transcriptional regulator
MPKVINDIEKNIFDSAMELFGDFGFGGVDMKMIANKAGIAVGTLYNYYPNKMQLYQNVLESSWDNTLKKIDEKSKSDLSPKGKIRKFLEVLYDDIEDRKGLGSEIAKEKNVDINKESKNMPFMSAIVLRFLEQINLIEKEVGCSISKEHKIKFIETLIASIPFLLKSYPQEKEDNIDFLTQTIYKFIK